MACKSGGHVCVGYGPALPAELAARLGPRYDLNLELRDFDVIFSVGLKLLATSISKRALLSFDTYAGCCVAPSVFATAWYCLSIAKLPWVPLPKAGRRASPLARLCVAPPPFASQEGLS